MMATKSRLAILLCALMSFSLISQVYAILIEPIEFATFLGGSGGESAYDIAVDSTGHIYITGKTTSSDFVRPSYGSSDIFVAKLSPWGVPVYIKQFGGSQFDEGRAIAVDNDGNAYIAGYTESTGDFAVMYDTYAGPDSRNIVALKLNGAGELVYSAIVGGNEFDKPGSIAVDEDGSVYIAGSTDSLTFPMVSPYLSEHGNVFPHGFVFKLEPSGSSLNYSTYIGNIASDYYPPIVLDEDHAIVTRFMDGSSHILRFNRTGNGATEIKSLQDRIDAYVLKNNQLVSMSESGLRTLSMAGVVSLSYDIVTSSTLIAVDADSEGNVYATGYTTNQDFPMLHELYTPHGGVISDIFLLKISPTAGLQYSTAYRGPDRHGEEKPTSLAVTEEGVVHITGFTTDEQFPLVNPYDSTLNGSDCVVIKMNDLIPEMPSLTTDTTPTTTPVFTTPFPLDVQTLLLVAGVGGTIVVIVSVIAVKRR
ncbi:MAG: SBBP repeat-containing protein [Candidatus Thorarchaeota archaeon]